MEAGFELKKQILEQKKEHEKKQALGQTGATGETRDGMAAVLCIWHKDTNKLEYAGANNPLYIVTGHWSLVTGKNNQKQETSIQKLIEDKADKQPS